MKFPFGKENSYRRNQVKSIQEKIQIGGSVSDITFDSLYPEPIQRISSIQWTPIEVIELVLATLKLSPTDCLLDVGSGVGKFCLYSGISSQAMFVGIEKRKHLFEIAEGVRKEFQLKNVKFIKGDMSELDWTKFNVFYFYNPFYESLTTKNTIDDREEKGLQKYTFDLILVKNRLSSLRVGTRVVTYHTFGGKMPNSYILDNKIQVSTGDIEIYTKIS